MGKIYIPKTLIFSVKRILPNPEEQGVELIDCGYYLFSQNRIAFISSKDALELNNLTDILAKADISTISEVITFKSFCDHNKNTQMIKKIKNICGINSSVVLLHPDEYKDKGCIRMSVNIPEVSFKLITEYDKIEKL